MAAGWILAGVFGCLVCFVFFAPDRVVYWREIRKGDELVERVEGFRAKRGRLPSAEELLIDDEYSMRFWYLKCDDAHYIVGFGTTLGESMSYGSERRKWESVTRVCER